MWNHDVIWSIVQISIHGVYQVFNPHVSQPDLLEFNSTIRWSTYKLNWLSSSPILRNPHTIVSNPYPSTWSTQAEQVNLSLFPGFGSCVYNVYIQCICSIYICIQYPSSETCTLPSSVLFSWGHRHPTNVCLDTNPCCHISFLILVTCSVVESILYSPPVLMNH